MLPKNSYPSGFEEYAEEGLNDPLANVEQFNIIQFLQEGDSSFNMPIENFDVPQVEQKIDTSLHSQQIPQPQQMMMMQPHPQMAQHLQHAPMYQQSQQSLQLAPGMPMMPAITDLTRHGSSSSPSTTNSDPPYSPEDMNQYGLGTQRMNRGVIPNDHIMPPEMLQRQFIDPRAVQNLQLNSPAPASSFNPLLHRQQPTPGSYIQSISPDSQHDGQGFVQSNLYNVLNVSSDDSISGHSEETQSRRKRPRMEHPIDPSYILSAALSGKILPELQEEAGGQPNIKFLKYQEEQCFPMYDATGTEPCTLQVHVIADKGFNYSNNDNCFVNQKKNHFQVSVHIEAIDNDPPAFVKINDLCMPIEQFQISFTGVKSESMTSEVQIRQSTTDRKPVLHTPVLLKIVERRMTKVTVPRLHFSETTLNNQRKNLRPNPDQKYFQLVVRLHAVGLDGSTVLVQSFASERVIVRATNPGSFEPPEMGDASWNKNGGVLSTTGPVVIGKSEPRAQLTVDGDIYMSGRVTCPSDIRLKENITEKEARDALENLRKLRIVDYFYKPEVAEKWGLSEEQRKRTGVIAQELAAVLPDAVKDLGDYLTVNESRVFYETVLATQELCRLTGDLDQKIDEKVEEISKRLSDYAHKKKMFGSIASTMNTEGKSISGSRASLDSAISAETITNTKKNRRSNRRSHRREGSSQEENRPAKRVAHGTVIGLVGVMAFCLIAMSALYILDWHNRNYGYHHVTPSSTTSGPKEGPGNLVIPLDNYVPISQPDAPPLAPVCPRKDNKCQEYCCRAYDAQNPDPPQFDDNNEINDDNDYSYKSETRSDFKMSDFGNNVRITLPESGQSIDERYCIEKSCVPKRKVYNLFIPMTRWMPAQPVEVQIDVPTEKHINNCGYIPEFENMECNDQQTNAIPKSEKIFEGVYRLSAGQWTQSAYRFRVGYTSGLCDIPEGTFGGFFEEYNLIFYRVCRRTASYNATFVN